MGTHPGVAGGHGLVSVQKKAESEIHGATLHLFQADVSVSDSLLVPPESVAADCSGLNCKHTIQVIF